MASSTVSFVAIAVALMAFLQPAATSPPAPPATGVPTSCAYTLYTLFDCLPSVLASPESICLCHLISGEANDFANSNIDPIRLALLPFVCLAIVPPQLPAMCFVGPVPPISTVPPSSPAALPPPSHN
uniref:Bifunctional inhibitor/plant lipid transfer protein/seed storage helical domain-containing protein n=1 Tax=Setaria italica TaxID=4555 RepID=K3ZME7_SETIT